MFENPRRGKQARNFTTNGPKILDLKSSSEQIFSENWRLVPLIYVHAYTLLQSLHRLAVRKDRERWKSRLLSTECNSPESAIFSSFSKSVSHNFSIKGVISFSFPALKVGVSVLRIRFHLSSREDATFCARVLFTGFWNWKRLRKFGKSLTIICFKSSGSATTSDGLPPKQMVNTLPYFLRKARCIWWIPLYFLASRKFPRNGTGLGPGTFSFLRSAKPLVPYQYRKSATKSNKDTVAAGWARLSDNNNGCSRSFVTVSIFSTGSAAKKWGWRKKKQTQKLSIQQCPSTFKHFLFTHHTNIPKHIFLVTITNL